MREFYNEMCAQFEKQATFTKVFQHHVMAAILEKSQPCAPMILHAAKAINVYIDHATIDLWGLKGFNTNNLAVHA